MESEIKIYILSKRLWESQAILSINLFHLYTLVVAFNFLQDLEFLLFSFILNCE